MKTIYMDRGNLKDLLENIVPRDHQRPTCHAQGLSLVGFRTNPLDKTLPDIITSISYPPIAREFTIIRGQRQQVNLAGQRYQRSIHTRHPSCEDSCLSAPSKPTKAYFPTYPYPGRIWPRCQPAFWSKPPCCALFRGSPRSAWSRHWRWTVHVMSVLVSIGGLSSF